MKKTAAYGIKSIKFTDAHPEGITGLNGSSVSWSAFEMKAIVKDSFSFQDQAAGESNIEVEDMDDYYAILKSDTGTEGFSVQTYDLSAAAYAFFFGYTSSGSGDGGAWNVEPAEFTLPNKAVQIITRALGDEFPSKQFEWANMKLTVSKTGTLGKSGFPNIQIDFKKVACIDSTTGKETAGARWKVLTA